MLELRQGNQIVDVFQANIKFYQHGFLISAIVTGISSNDLLTSINLNGSYIFIVSLSGDQTIAVNVVLTFDVLK